MDCSSATRIASTATFFLSYRARGVRAEKKGASYDDAPQTRSEKRRAVDEVRSGPLPLVLKLDAVASGALGALSLAASPALDDLLGTPLALVVPVGAFLVAWAAALWVLASCSTVSFRESIETIEGFAGVKGTEMRVARKGIGRWLVT